MLCECEQNKLVQLAICFLLFFPHTQHIAAQRERKKDDGGNDDDGNDYNFFLPSEKLPHEVNVTGNEAKRK